MKFPIESFPPWARNLILEIEAVTTAKPEFAGLGILFAGSICTPKWKVKIKTHYEVSTNLFCAIVAPKGAGKSIGLSLPTSAIEAHFENTLLSFSEAHAEWLEKYKAAAEDRTKKGKEYLRMLKDEEPKSPWWGWVTDGTTEGISLAAKENAAGGHPARITRFSEELDSWVGSIGQYKQGSGGSDLGFYLQGYDGKVVMLKNKSEAGVTPRFWLNLGGTIQPTVFADAFRGKSTDNGLLDRFMVVCGNYSPSEEDDPYTEFSTGVVDIYNKAIMKVFQSCSPISKTVEVPESLREIPKSFKAWTSHMDRQQKTGAAPKWWGQYHKVLGILCALWDSPVNESMLKATSEVMKYYCSHFIRAHHNVSITDGQKVERRITELLEKHDVLSIAKIRTSLTRSDREVCETVLQDMEADGIIVINDVKASNGKASKEVRFA